MPDENKVELSGSADDESVKDELESEKKVPKLVWSDFVMNLAAFTGSSQKLPGKSDFFARRSRLDSASIIRFRKAVAENESTEHEKTRQLIVDKLAALPQREDLLAAKDEIIGSLRLDIDELQQRLLKLRSELATAQDMESNTKKLCVQMREEHESTRTQLKAESESLRGYLAKLTPPKRFFRVTFSYLFFFSVSLILSSLIGLRVVEPFWAKIGVGLSAAMLVVIYFGVKDTQSDVSHSENVS